MTRSADESATERVVVRALWVLVALMAAVTGCLVVFAISFATLNADVAMTAFNIGRDLVVLGALFTGLLLLGVLVHAVWGHMHHGHHPPRV